MASFTLLPRSLRHLGLVLLMGVLALPAAAQEGKIPPKLRDRIPKLPPLERVGAEAFRDPAAIERGTQMLADVIAAAGGYEAWEAAGGMSFQVLRIVRAITHRDDDLQPTKIRVHHYQPKYASFTPDGDGFLFTEFAQNNLSGPNFRREVVFEEAAWVEMYGKYLRTNKARTVSRAEVDLEFLLGCMPFSLQANGMRAAFVRNEEIEGKRIEVYALRPAQPINLQMFPLIAELEDYKEFTEFVLYVDPETKGVLQLQYAFLDRAMRNKSKMRRAYVDFEDWVDVPVTSAEGETRTVKLSKKRYRWMDQWTQIDEWWTEELAPGPLSPESLRRPWQTGQVFRMTKRADFWDPPEGVPGLGPSLAGKVIDFSKLEGQEEPGEDDAPEKSP